MTPKKATSALKKVQDEISHVYKTIYQGNGKPSIINQISHLENNLKNLENLLNENKQKLLVCETQILSMKEEIKMISEVNKDYIKQIQTMKEKLAADEATKKAKQESTNPNP
jgi:deoxyribodipyrimidine photolyase